MQRGSDSERVLIKRAIESGDADLLEEVVRIVRDTGALEITRDAASAEAARAIAAVGRLPKSPYSECMVELASDLLRRQV